MTTGEPLPQPRVWVIRDDAAPSSSSSSSDVPPAVEPVAIEDVDGSILGLGKQVCASNAVIRAAS